jgi:hypothetical protein
MYVLKQHRGPEMQPAQAFEVGGMGGPAIRVRDGVVDFDEVLTRRKFSAETRSIKIRIGLALQA